MGRSPLIRSSPNHTSGTRPGARARAGRFESIGFHCLVDIHSFRTTGLELAFTGWI
jgi:hypothetical protein